MPPVSRRPDIIVHDSVILPVTENRAALETTMTRTFALALAILAATAAPGWAQPAPGTPAPGRVVITGHGEANVPPDLALLTVGIVTEGATAREALDLNNAAMRQAVDLIKQTGIADRDLQTARISVQPRYAQENNRRQRITGAQASNQLTVRVRDLAKVGDILDRAVSLGANSVSGPVFGLQNPETAQDAARKAAIADARRRASLAAEALGLRLGRVVLVEEPDEDARPIAVMRAAPAPAAAAPVEAGETTVRASVRVTWELAP